MDQELAQFLHSKRVAAGLTQMAVANKLGYSTPQFISNWERGISQPPMTILVSLSRMYEVPEQVLFDLLLKTTLARVEHSMRDEFGRLRKS